MPSALISTSLNKQIQHCRTILYSGSAEFVLKEKKSITYKAIYNIILSIIMLNELLPVRYPCQKYVFCWDQDKL